MGETRPGVDFAKAKNTAYSYWSPLRRARKRSEQLRPPSSSGLGHCPFTAAARVRIPLGVQTTIYGCQVEKSIGLRKQGPVAQLVSAPPCHGGGRGFKSRQGRSINRSSGYPELLLFLEQVSLRGQAAAAQSTDCSACDTQPQRWSCLRLPTPECRASDRSRNRRAIRFLPAGHNPVQ